MVTSPARVPATVVANRTYLEAPRWRDGRVYVSDMYADEVIAVDPADGSVEVVAQVPGEPGGLGWLPDGRMLAVSMEQRTVLRQEPDGELVIHADLSGLTSWPINDMVVDSRGNAYVGGLGFDLHAYGALGFGALYHISPDGTVQAHGEGLRGPNGLAILPGGRTLVMAETFGARLTAFDVAADGSLSGQRVWADFGRPDIDDFVAYAQSGAVIPDGICADAEGAVWFADIISGRAVRVREGGELADEFVHDTLVVAPALGGEDGKTLYLTTAPSVVKAERLAAPEAELISVRVDVPHGAHS